MVIGFKLFRLASLIGQDNVSTVSRSLMVKTLPAGMLNELSELCKLMVRRHLVINFSRFLDGFMDILYLILNIG